MSVKENKKFQTQSHYNRCFSVELKKSKVSDIEKRLLSVKDVTEQLQVTRTSVYRWLYLYGSTEKGLKTVVQMDSEQVKTEQLKRRIAELERSVGQKQLQIDVLEKIVEFGGEAAGFDLKKKYATAHSNGLGSSAINAPTA